MSKKTQLGNVFISPRELANRWNISVSAGYMHRAGTENLIRHRFGRSVRFSLAEIEKFENEILSKTDNGEKHYEK